jgi:Fe-S-cluster containining protein
VTDPDPTPPAEDTANLHLQLLGEEHTVPVPVPLGRRTVLDLLPAARALADRATAVAVGQAEAAGRPISCRKGCGACCRQLVAISVVEAESLAGVVAAMPPERQAVVRRRFADAVRRLEEAGLLDPAAPPGDRLFKATDRGDKAATVREVGRRYFALRIACPFLDDESCGIHPDRPMVCREYHVTSAAADCSRLYEVGVDRVMPPLRMGEVLARTAARAAGGPAGMIPLVLALEWSAAHGAGLRRPGDGLDLFRAMAAAIDPDHDRPFDDRGE